MNKKTFQTLRAYADTLAPPHRRVGLDPHERMIAHALDEAGIAYATDYEGQVPEHLDFFLKDLGVFVEVKGGHSPRIAEQMARAENVICAQGSAAVALLAALIANNLKLSQHTV